MGNRALRGASRAHPPGPAQARRVASGRRTAARARRIVAAALGADEFGFGTAALVAIGCVIAHQCHLDTCPAGITTRPASNCAPVSKARPRWRPHISRCWRATSGSRSPRLGVVRSTTWSGDPISSAARGRIAARLRPDNAARTEPAAAGGSALAHVQDRRTSRTTLSFQRRSATVERWSCEVLSGTWTGPWAPRSPARYARFRAERAAARGQSGCNSSEVQARALARSWCQGSTFISPVRRTTTSARGCTAGRWPSGFRRRPQSANRHAGGDPMLYGATGGHLFVRGAVGKRLAVHNSGAVAVVEGIGDRRLRVHDRRNGRKPGEPARNFVVWNDGGTAYVYAGEPRTSPLPVTSSTRRTGGCFVAADAALAADRQHPRRSAARPAVRERATVQEDRAGAAGAFARHVRAIC